MIFDEKDMLLIEDYLDGQLSGDDLKAFKKRLKSDDDFTKALEFRQSMPGLMKEASDYEATRKEVREAILEEKRSGFFRKRNWFYAAATILTLVGLVALLVFSVDRNSDSENQMADENKKETLGLDKPAKYANLDSVINSLEIISPTDFQSFNKGDAISLKWETQSELSGTLIISKYENDEILLEKEIFLADQTFVFQSNKLESGNYTWYINDTLFNGTFRVKKN